MKLLRWLSLSIVLSALVVITGCATTQQPQAPRELHYVAPMEQTFRAAVELMVAQGYVVRHADLALGRAEATLARWPEYRLQLQVSEVNSGSRVSVSARRGNQPLAPYLLDPWLVELQAKLGEAP